VAVGRTDPVTQAIERIATATCERLPSGGTDGDLNRLSKSSTGC
jgi:hypothetical protein